MSIESYLIVFIGSCCWFGLSHVPNLQIRLPFPFIGLTASHSLAIIPSGLILWIMVGTKRVHFPVLQYYLLPLDGIVRTVMKTRRTVANFEYLKKLILLLCFLIFLL